MKVLVIGLPSSGKTTVFRALTGAEPAAGAEPSHAAVAVPDDAVDRLSALYKPKKTTHASVEFVDLGQAAGLRKDRAELGQKFLAEARQARALVHVADAFSLPTEAAASVAEAVQTVDQELVLADLQSAEKRIERLRKEGLKAIPAQQELALLEPRVAWLEQGRPLRIEPSLCDEERLRSFAFLTEKPCITVVNTSEESPGFDPAGLPAEVRAIRDNQLARFIALSAKLEAEIASLPPADARSFLADFGLEAPARERVIRACYELLGLMSFYTVGEDEVRAWTIRRGTRAQPAAGAIHSDIERGFIRAEVANCETVLRLGGFEAARKAGELRLEGRDYEVQPGDVISFRFNV